MSASGDDQKSVTGTLMNLKGALAFFLVIVAALLVVFLILILVRTDAKLDPGTIALFASMITTFILMAKSGCDYQFSSSAGSEKKDEVQASVSAKLADKVPTPPAAPPSVPVPPWWSRLTDAEKNAITAAAGADPRVQAFVTASQVGAATKDDLAYLVSKTPSLLTQDRATTIAAP